MREVRDWLLACALVGSILLLGMGQRQKLARVFYPGPCAGLLQLQAQMADGTWVTIKEVSPGTCLEINETVARAVRSCCGEGNCAEPGLSDEPVDPGVCR